MPGASGFDESILLVSRALHERGRVGDGEEGEGEDTTSELVGLLAGGSAYLSRPGRRI